MSEVKGPGGVFSEKFRLEIEADAKNVRTATEELRHLQAEYKKYLALLAKAQAQGNKGMESIRTTRVQAEYANLTGQMKKMLSVKTAEKLKKEQKAFEDLRGEAKRLTEQYKQLDASKNTFTRGFGGLKTKQNKEDFKKWQAAMNSAGLPIVGRPKSIEMAVANFRNLKSSLNDINKAGIATKGTVTALETGLPSAFKSGLSFAQRFQIQLGAVRKDLNSLFYNLHNHAKDTQWLGRQMIQGITVPVLGLGAMALYAFNDVNRSMLQVKKLFNFEGDFEAMQKDIREVAHEFALTDNAVTKLYEDIAALGVKDPGEIKKWAGGVAQIAQLGDVNLGDATTLFRVMNATFANGDVDKTNKIMAELNAVVDESSIRLKDLVATLPTAAPVMKQLGFDAAGTAIALTSMYKRGIDANVAAHALSFGMQRIAVPTAKGKEAMDSLGISFFNAAGMFTDADRNLANFALTVENLAPQDRLKVLGDIFQTRQANKFSAMFEDMAKGLHEIQNASKDGIITKDEFATFTSDYARTMAASGKIAVEGMEDIQNRYDNLWKKFRDDPTMQLDRLKGDFKAILISLGNLIVPALLQAGEKVLAFFEKLNSMPNFVKKGIAAVVLLAAAMGPTIYAFAQLEHSIATFGRIATAVLPKAYKDIDKVQAIKLFNENPDRTDIAQVGNRFVKLKEGKGAPKGGKVLTKDTLELTAAEKKLELQLDATNEEIREQAASLTADSKATSKTSGRTQRLAREKALLEDQVKEGEKARKKIEKFADKKTVLSPKKLLKLDNLVKDGEDAGKKLEKMLAIEGRRSGKAWGLEATRGIKSSLSSKLSGIGKLFSRLMPNGKGNGLGSLMAQDFSLAKKEASGLKGVLSGLFAGGKTGATEMGSSVMKMALSFGKFTVIIGVVIAIGALLMTMFKDWQKGFKIIRNVIAQPLANLKEAFSRLGQAFSEIGDKFKGVIGELGGGDGQGKNTLDFWQTIGKYIGKVINLVAASIALLAEGVKAAWPLISGVAYVVKDVIAMVSAAISGDWNTAFQYFFAIVYEFIRPVIGLFELLLNAVIWTMQRIVNVVFGAFKPVQALINGFLGLFSDAKMTLVDDAEKSINDALQGAADFNLVDWMDDMFRNNMPKVDMGDNVDVNIPEDKAKESGDNFANDFTNQANERIPDALAEGVKDWLPEWLSAVKSRLQKQIEELKKSAQKAFEASQKAQMDALDGKIKAIDDLEEAEQRLYEEQQYIEKRKEMLYKRSIDIQNYQRNRALAIYEGRIDDARMLDLEEQKNKHDFNKELKNLEDERSRALLKQQRDAQRKAIEKEKEELGKRQEIEKEAFEKSLEQITEYTPRTVAEYEKMLGGISGLVNQYGGEWPVAAGTAMTNMALAFQQANEDIRQDFSWSGLASITSWMAAFAAPDVIEMLRAQSAGNGSAVKDGFDSGMAGIGDDPFAEMRDNSKFTMDEMGKDLFDFGKDIGKFWDSIGSGSSVNLDAILKDFWNGVEEIKGWFGRLPEAVFGSLRNALAGWGNIIFEFIEGLIETGRQAINAMPGPDIAPIKLPRFDRVYATGGLVTNGMTALAGEGAYPEFVIPTDPKYRSNAMRLTGQLVSQLNGKSYSRAGTSSATLNGNVASVAGAAADAAGTTFIIDTMIGEEQWFNKNMKRWDKTVAEKKATATGSQKRVISKYNDNQRGGWSR